MRPSCVRHAVARRVPLLAQAVAYSTGPPGAATYDAAAEIMPAPTRYSSKYAIYKGGWKRCSMRMAHQVWLSHCHAFTHITGLVLADHACYLTAAPGKAAMQISMIGPTWKTGSKVSMHVKPCV